MTPKTSELIFKTMASGFLCTLAGAAWLWGGVGLFAGGLVLIMVGVLLGFVPYKKKGG